ncbi:MAG: class C sortase [Clostridia bacterium]|nr:class C sortase [Clostridia bacterium]
MSKVTQHIKKRLPLVGIFLLLLIGLAVFMYPIASNWLQSYTARTEINSYDEIIQNLGNDALRKAERDAQRYNAALASVDTNADSVLDYDQVLAVAEAIGYVEIPKIGVYLPIYHGLDDDVLQKGIGHMEGSSLPIGGKSTHSVLAGHTGLPSAELFTDLDQMKIGDAFYIHTLDKVLKYQVDQIKTVLPHELSDIQIQDDKDYVTLLTCTPYGINSHRLLVRGERVPYETQTMENTYPWPVVHSSEKQLPVRTIVWYAATALIVFVIVVIIVILLFPGRKRRGKKKENDDRKQQNANPE